MAKKIIRRTRKQVYEMWIKALRSGKYKQGNLHLHNKTEDTFCCLGVLCALAVKDGGQWPGFEFSITDELQTFMGIGPAGDHESLGRERGGIIHLTQLNDSGTSFAVIADLIEEKIMPKVCA